MGAWLGPPVAVIQSLDIFFVCMEGLTLNTMVANFKKKEPFTARVYNTVQAHAMLSPGDVVLAGVSGGADSVALLGILKELALSFSLQIGVAHVNHCLRGEESDRDEAFVRDLAASHGLPLHVQQTDVAARARKNKKSIEDAARDVRYAFYREIASRHGYNRVALGHNSDDNAEQVLMNLLRGSGPRGLMGIPPMRDNLIIRPLIRVSRQEILAFLDRHGQPFVQDSSNEDTRYLRNRIRHGLMPCLSKEYNPDIKSALNRLSVLITAEETWMEGESRAMLARHLERLNPREVRFSRDFFATLPKALARRGIRGAIQEIKGDLRRITFGHVDDIMALMPGNTGGKNLDLPQGIRITLTKKWLYFTRCDRPLRQLGPLH
ncbi:tRNA(Ile)-lysidine synthase [Desulfocicer vacuolatum DSM 3385]|uniref:tRNA(Ile)-lysidine synthase n=1 Tax=Desulfocicer vacuolatum DSM 3385 TaxID=1121400 RepID=A0A1W2E000_9BACT|nr:tRNA lysidine(34) synthetase TilS [Desulfocicer vacuolatum]SMD02646.1 tRNA(Ile)-lysidine synthase [Desulfocicer vacuolatum DSM 3385]